MNRSHTSLIPPPVTRAVLLIFLPTERADRQLRAALTTIANSLQRHFDQSMGVLKIDEMSYPDVVQSFGITHFPAFVLVSHGVELWRHEGLLDEHSLLSMIPQLLNG